MNTHFDIVGAWAGHYLNGGEPCELFVSVTHARDDGKHWDGQIETRAEGVLRAWFHVDEESTLHAHLHDHAGFVFYTFAREGDALVGQRKVVGRRAGEVTILPQPLRLRRANDGDGESPRVRIPDNLDPTDLAPKDITPEPGQPPFEPLMVERIVYPSGTWTGHYMREGRRIDMTLQLEFRRHYILGTAVDEDGGTAVIDGLLDRIRGEVFWWKIGTDGARHKYKGNSDANCLAGTWQEEVDEMTVLRREPARGEWMIQFAPKAPERA